LRGYQPAQWPRVSWAGWSTYTPDLELKIPCSRVVPAIFGQQELCPFVDEEKGQNQ